MHIASSLAKGTFAQERDSEAEGRRLKAYNDGVMALLKKSQEEKKSEQGKDGNN